MIEPQFVSADKIKTLNQYGAVLLTSLFSLKTLESFHLAAFKEGLLDQDEEECSKTILWEIQRLKALYQKQLENVMNRCELDKDQVLADLQSLAPSVKRPRKKKNDG